MIDIFSDPPAHRHTDPDTSRNAKQYNLKGDRIAVLVAHSRVPDGMTDYELAAMVGKQQNSAGKRRTELRDHGYVEETPLRRPAPSGSLCIVWRITPAGAAMARLFERQELFGA
jgi:hypothetical protein